VNGIAPVSGIPQPAPRQQELRAAAEAFEAIFVRQMIGSMRAASLTEDPFASASSGQFRDMADARLADDMASRGQFGVADMLMQQFGGRLAKDDAP
jgi:peptidoglycan hydrolase FlgJ